MIELKGSVLGAAIFAVGLGGCAMQEAKSTDKAMKNMAHVHMGHVLSGWKDTPDKGGFLPTAMAEAKIAAQHAGFAASKPDNLKWMQTHAVHVVNAVDPSVEPKGPGKGYGVMKAATGTAQHIKFAADSEGASKNVKTHAGHVGVSAGNVTGWAAEIVALGAKIKGAKRAAEAAPLVAELKVLADRLLAGNDANGDGKVTWQEGEGGLMVADQHMGFMKKGEGMN